MDTANAFVNDCYIDKYNERFGVVAKCERCWRRLGPGMYIDNIYSFRYSAKVANDNAVRFCKLVFDIALGPGGRIAGWLLAHLLQR